MTGADGALSSPGLFWVAVGRLDGALWFWISRRVPSRAGIWTEDWDLCLLLGDLLKELDALKRRPPGLVTSF